jgi:aldehyde dehydrogenase (NAD+)
VAPDYIFVAESVVKNFTKALIESIKRFYGESPDGSDQMGKIINDFHMKRLTELLDSSSGQIIYGGRTN